MPEPQTAAATAPTARFEAIVADTEFSRRIHYRLRYDVYCLDSGFEDPSAFPNEEESDSFDRRAAHFLLRCTETGEWLAAARLISRGDDPLPVEAHCAISPKELTAYGPIDGEISRVLIVRRGPRAKPRDLAEREDVSCSRTEILRRLLIGVFTVAQDLGMRNTAFFITPALKRVVGRLGIECLPIGDPCEHRGTRFPHLTNVQDSLEALYEHGPAMVGLAEVVHPYRFFSELDLPIAPNVPFHCGTSRCASSSPVL